jgi:hypothetical protein
MESTQRPTKGVIDLSVGDDPTISLLRETVKQTAAMVSIMDAAAKAAVNEKSAKNANRMYDLDPTAENEASSWPCYSKIRTT